MKPVREDGSVGIWRTSVVHSPGELARAVEAVVTTFRQPALVEQFIDGRELNVALIGHPTPRVLPLSEIDFGALPVDVPRIVSYDAKWTTGSVDDLGTVPVLHPQLPNAVAARVRRAAAEAFRAVGVRDYGRVDVRLAATGIPYVVDVNPNCDLSSGAGMARAAAAVGIDYGALVGPARPLRPAPPPGIVRRRSRARCSALVASREGPPPGRQRRQGIGGARR